MRKCYLIDIIVATNGQVRVVQQPLDGEDLMSRNSRVAVALRHRSQGCYVDDYAIGVVFDIIELDVIRLRVGSDELLMPQVECALVCGF